MRPRALRALLGEVSEGRGGGGGAVCTLWRRSLRALFLRFPFAMAPVHPTPVHAPNEAPRAAEQVEDFSGKRLGSDSPLSSGAR
mmetsp:Transcript_9450/g.27719  ORF Transcript_9450/g.27719 Transcript_9450/m.27719 type:complete len:84 (-) Transcript_9450:67-318(-)